jgi:hypothetical protein
MLENNVSRGENFLTQPLSLKSSLELRKNTSDTIKNIQAKDIEKGLDFILSHFEQPVIFPRTISTFKSNNSQIMVRYKEEILIKYEESNFIDCRINAFPSLKERAIWSSNFIFIDLDLADFKSQRALDLALNKTLKNIKERLDGHPTLLWTGGGYHIYQPIDGIEFAKYRDFNKFNDYNLFNEFLRFSKNFLSNGKEDPHHHPSLNSCLLRIPNSINFKYNKQILIRQEWNNFRPHINLLIGKFMAYLVTKNQKESLNIIHRQYKINVYQNEIQWIEKLLQTPIEDGRKYALWKILCPYLVNIKQLSYEESSNLLENWLNRCDRCNKLSFNTKYEIKTKLRFVKSYLPISLSKLKIDNPEFFKTLQDMKILES